MQACGATLQSGDGGLKVTKCWWGSSLRRTGLVVKQELQDCQVVVVGVSVKRGHAAVRRLDQRVAPFMLGIHVQPPFKELLHDIEAVRTHCSSKRCQIIFPSVRGAEKRPMPLQNHACDVIPTCARQQQQHNGLLPNREKKTLMGVPRRPVTEWPWHYHQGLREVTIKKP